VIEFVENSRVPNGWSEYGFEWGGNRKWR
jgi:hypothetical protein